MAEMMKKVLGYFQDSDGNNSFGRVASAYCVVASVFAFAAGLILPAMASYCAGSTSAFLLSAAGFYGTSKGQQVFTNWLSPRMSQPSTGEEPR